MKSSVIVPAHNSADTIEECLESILGQGETDFEVIVVDDGSIDDTGELVKKYPVKLIAQENRGPAAARNMGARNASGEILVFTDSDCVAENNWLSEMLRPFEDPEIAGVQGRYKTKQHNLIARFAQYEIEERYERMAKYEYINFIGSYSAAYRKEIFLREGGFDEGFPIASGEDPELSFRLADKGYKMVFNPSAIVNHHHPDTLGKYLKQKFYRAYWRVALYKKNPRRLGNESYTPQLVKIQVVMFYLLVLSIFAVRARGLMFLVLLLSMLPLSIAIFRKDKAVGLISPIMLLLRTAVHGVGLFVGALWALKNSFEKFL